MRGHGECSTEMAIVVKDQILSSITNAVVGQLTERYFGAIGVNNFGYHYFEDHTAQLGMTDIRFPGGEVSEAGYVVDGHIRLGSGDVSFISLQGDRSNFAFDLTHPELMSPVALEFDDDNFSLRDDIYTFSQVLDLAHSRSVGVNLIIPVERYFIGADYTDLAVRALAAKIAREDISIFLDRLKSGHFNNGILPDVISFDIGNEAYANPIEYAFIAEVLISEINAQMRGSGIDYRINFQAGRGSVDLGNLLDAGYLDRFFDRGFDMVPGLQGLEYLLEPNLSFEERQVAIDRIMANILGESVQYLSGVRQHYLGVNSDALGNARNAINERGLIVDFWTAELARYGIERSQFDYYISAWSTNTNDAGGLPYEMAGAANTLELFARFLEMGVDAASAWGITSEFRFKETMSSTTITDRLSDFLSPQAAILQLLSKYAIDSDFIGSAGNFDNGQMRYYYETSGEYVVFFTVGELAGIDLHIQFDLGLLGDVETVTVVNLDIDDGSASGASRQILQQQTVVEGKVSIDFDQSHEIAVLSISKADSDNYLALEMIEMIMGLQFHSPIEIQTLKVDSTSTNILGGYGTDLLLGDDKNEVLSGGGGRSSLLADEQTDANISELGRYHGDFLFGRGGNDMLYGYSGNDLLSGGEGDDDLWGGSGFDKFVFVAGNDTIHDFDYRVDAIYIRDSLLIDCSVVDFVLDNARFSEGSATIAFSENDSLTINGVETIDQFLGEIVVLDFADDLFFW
jgi:hypothetical protein